MRLVSCTLLLLSTALCSFARLGETESELGARYGKVIMRSPEMTIEQGKARALADNLHFRMENWHVTARIINGRCESISYHKPGEWTEEQLRHILESNGTRAQWEERKTPSPKTHRTWLRRDSATAVWRLLQGMTLETRTFVKAREALKQRTKEESAKLPKF